jgi:hypothetical protein
MATYSRTEIETQRDLAMERLTDCLSSPKMDYQVGGQSFNWTQYQLMLREQIDWCNEELLRLAGPEIEETIIDM